MESLEIYTEIFKFFTWQADYPLSAISFTFLHLPVIIGAVNYRKLENKGKILNLYFGITLVFAWLQSITAYKGFNNLWIMHVYSPIEFCLIAVIFYYYYENTVFKKIIIVLLGIIPVLLLINTIWLQSIKIANTNASGITGILMISMAVGYFIKTMKERKIIRIEKDAMFWISSAVLINFSVNFFILFFFNIYMIHSLEKFIFYFNIYCVMNIIFIILLILGLCLDLKK